MEVHSACDRSSISAYIHVSLHGRHHFNYSSGPFILWYLFEFLFLHFTLVKKIFPSFQKDKIIPIDEQMSTRFRKPVSIFEI